MNRGFLRRRGNTASCREVGKVLQGYLDGEVDDAIAARVAPHLDECRRCGLEAETYNKIKAVLASGAPQADVQAIERLRAFGEELVNRES